VFVSSKFWKDEGRLSKPKGCYKWQSGEFSRQQKYFFQTIALKEFFVYKMTFVPSTILAYLPAAKCLALRPVFFP
jgi:hypothetical protein